MKLKPSPGRIVVKKREAKLKSSILLPPARAKLYEIGEVVSVGALDAYGHENKYSTKETYAPGDLVLFQLPIHVAGLVSHEIKGVLHAFLHADDIIGRLASDTITVENFFIVGQYLLLEPTVRQLSSVIITPDNAKDANQESIHFSVAQMGKDVTASVTKGQEVFPDRARANPISIDSHDFVFIHQQSILGCLSAD